MKTEIIDLLDLEDKTIDCDICIIGAGAAGIFLASRLGNSGLKVILLEAGGKNCLSAEDAGFALTSSSSPYLAASLGRSFGIGGTTSRWGGLLIPHVSNDLPRDDHDIYSPWPRIVKTNQSQCERVLLALGYKFDPCFETYSQTVLGETLGELSSIGLTTMASLFLPIQSKNLSFLLKDTFGVKVIYNATVTEWQTYNELNRYIVRSLVVQAPDKEKYIIRGNRFVIAAGSLESTRLLLELYSKENLITQKKNDHIGQCLGDHISVSIGDVPPQSREAIITKFAPRFCNGWLRSFRFIEYTRATTIPRSFAHFIFDLNNPSFLLVKEIIRSIQQRTKPKISLIDIMRGARGALALGVDRYFRNRLHIPSNTPVHLQLDMEQLSNSQNKIILGEEKDSLGRRQLHINWNISAEEKMKVELIAKKFIGRWNSADLPKISSRDLTYKGTKYHDAFHPVGTCAMGEEGSSVVDENMKVWGVDNLWIASTAVFPSAGTANPTFSLLCLTQSLSDQLFTLSKST